MRRTLWAERQKRRGEGDFKADGYLHVCAAPQESRGLLGQPPPGGGRSMEDIWEGRLAEPDKHVVISPEKLWSEVDEGGGYESVKQYLRRRYW